MPFELPDSVESLETVPEAFRGAYTEAESGFALDVEKVSTAFTRYSKLPEFRENNEKLKKELKTLQEQSATSAAAAEELAELKQRIADEEKKRETDERIGADDVENMVKERAERQIAEYRTEAEGKITSLESELEKARSEGEDALLRSELSRYTGTVGLEEGAFEDLMLRAKQQVRKVEGQFVPHDGDDPVYGKDAGYQSLQEWMVSLASKPGSKHLFKPSQDGGSQGGARGQALPTSLEGMSVGDKAELKASNPDHYNKLVMGLGKGK